jgi:hypothetical protein
MIGLRNNGTSEAMVSKMFWSTFPVTMSIERLGLRVRCASVAPSMSGIAKSTNGGRQGYPRPISITPQRGIASRALIA